MKPDLPRSLCRGQGVTTTETVILLVLIAMVVIATVKVLGGDIRGKVELANDSVGAVSTENNEMARLRENQRKAEQRRVSGGGGSVGEPNGSSARVQAGESEAGAPPTDARARAGASTRSTPAVAPSGGCAGGFNPFLIPIILGMLGLLGYVIAKSQKG